MINKFITHIERHFPEIKELQVFVAVSGGVDSVVLLHLLKMIGVQPFALHCNFNLRGDASAKDAQLVEQICKEKGIDCQIKDFDTNAYLKNHKLNIQSAARELRYAWFEEIISTSGGLLLTAHHEDDLVETFMINLARGSGIKGLASIPLKRDFIRRPMSIFTKQEIVDFALSENLSWREDESNSESKYLRNELRLELLPKLESWQQGFSSNVGKSINYLAKVNAFMETSLEQFKHVHLQQKSDHELVDLHACHEKDMVLIELLLLEYGFSSDSIEKIVKAALLDKSENGISFKTSAYELFVGRKCLEIFQIGIQECGELILQRDQLSGDVNFMGKILQLEQLEGISLNEISNLEGDYIDFHALGEEVCLRQARIGDKMKPLGMHGYKLLSDIMIDEKWRTAEKRNAVVLESNGEIAWLSGFRISEDFKLKESTKYILKLHLEHE